MKKAHTLFLLVGIISIHSCKPKNEETKNNKVSTIDNPYLGQKPPGLTPIPFAPGLVSTEIYEYDGAFAHDMKAFYFIRRGEKNIKSTFYEYKYNDTTTVWEKSIVASPWIGRPVISPDGNTMHLGTSYLKRTETGWSSLQKLEPPIVSNDSMYIMRLSESANGTYYFDTYKENDSTFPIRYSRFINGKYETPKALPKAINTGTFLSHPFIAPDESYLLFDATREDGFGDADIYISFKQTDGTWGNGINIGDKINTDAWEASASITPDGKYLFFSRNVGSKDYENVDIFWVDVKVLENLRPKQ
ncbi:MAG: PD40 domain-containing protein [Flavobacteriaceae bacterium]|nr:PD40 domain-containing protein [Flavobacteriaceae bacterium]